MTDLNTTFKDFLKTHSNIDEKFIDDFINLFTTTINKDKHDDFVVDFDV